MTSRTRSSACLPTCNGLIALLLGLLAGGTFGRQFVLHPLEGLLIGLSLALGTANSVIFGQTLMGQLRLEIADHSLRLLQQSFSAFSRRCL